nr:hypothetical protein [Chloroflexota bacterium]
GLGGGGEMVNFPGIGMVNGNAAALAQTLAATGNLPSSADLKTAGTTFAEVSRIAKELPKSNGQVVDRNTGIRSSAIPAAAQEDFSRLYNITRMADELLALDNKRIGGVAAGTLGKMFGGTPQGEAQAAYLVKRKTIVDEMSRMQSGAALTEEEIAQYEDYLPGRFSEAFGLGQNSDKQIANFAAVMKDKLSNRLSNNGLSIYGYSKVNVAGQEYTAGDVIDNGAGLKGRVNPDGSLTTEESFSSAGNASASVQIPQTSRLSYVNNNPGNLRFAGQDGAVQGEGGFAKFKNAQAGLVALTRQIKLDASRGHSLFSFINKFAPPSENDTKNYVTKVAGQLGVSANTAIAKININKLTAAIAQMESGTKIG